MKKIMMLLMISLISGIVYADEDHHKPITRSLADLSHAMPGTGNTMIEIAYRYSALYHAAKQKQWPFAAYQLEEIEETFERLSWLKPKHKDSVEHFNATVIADLENALNKQEWQTFAAAFDKMRGECTACHAKNKVGFITVPIPKKHYSPVLK